VGLGFEFMAYILKNKLRKYSKIEITVVQTKMFRQKHIIWPIVLKKCLKIP
jgi:hypothetical protein